MLELSIKKVANGYVVEPVNRPGVARDQSKDTFVFETFDALVAYLAKQLEGVGDGKARVGVVSALQKQA